MNLSPRRVAERLLRNSRFKTRFPAKYGSKAIFLSAGNHLAVLKPGANKFDQTLLDWVDRFVAPDSVAWDIGVNMGLFSVPAAHVARQVIGFEPDPFNLELLNKTMQANPGLRLDVLPVALADQNGFAQLAIPERGRSANSLVGYNFGTQMGGVRASYTVTTVTADWVLEHRPAPDFIKCDAEGAELIILQGATKLLRDVRPVLVIEMPKENAAGCLEIFKRNDYLLQSAYVPVSRSAVTEDITVTWDTLAIPAEKFDGLIGR